MRNLFFKIGFFVRSKIKNLVLQYRFAELTVLYPQLEIKRLNVNFEDFPNIMIEGNVNKLKIGGGSYFRGKSSFYLGDKAKIIIGQHVFFNRGCSLNAMEGIEIGNDCLFGEDVKIYDHNHKFRKKEERINNQGYTKELIEIGDSCWIGSNVIILKGSIIGNNCVIAAGVIIRNKIPDNTLISIESESVVQNPINFK